MSWISNIVNMLLSRAPQSSINLVYEAQYGTTSAIPFPGLKIASPQFVFNFPDLRNGLVLTPNQIAGFQEFTNFIGQDQIVFQNDVLIFNAGSSKSYQFNYVPDYNNPGASIKYLGKLFGIPEDKLEPLITEAASKKGDKTWLQRQFAWIWKNRQVIALAIGSLASIIIQANSGFDVDPITGLPANSTGNTGTGTGIPTGSPVTTAGGGLDGIFQFAKENPLTSLAIVGGLGYIIVDSQKSKKGKRK